MKKALAFALLALALSGFYAGPLYAPLVTTIQETQSSQGSDTSTVDLSDKDTDAPVQSPSFENTTPAGQAPGGPIES
jgi:hypothetical protein